MKKTKDILLVLLLISGIVCAASASYYFAYYKPHQIQQQKAIEEKAKQEKAAAEKKAADEKQAQETEDRRKNLELYNSLNNTPSYQAPQPTYTAPTSVHCNSYDYGYSSTSTTCTSY